ncbi:unnamed protein product, partial [Amoebophrya sp. A25]
EEHDVPAASSNPQERDRYHADSNYDHAVSRSRYEVDTSSGHRDFSSASRVHHQYDEDDARAERGTTTRQP